MSLKIYQVHERSPAAPVASLYGTAGKENKLRVSLDGYGSDLKNRIAAARSVWFSFLYVQIRDDDHRTYYLNKLSLCKRLTGDAAAPGLCSFFSRIFLQLKILFSNQKEIIGLLRPPLVEVPHPTQSIGSHSASISQPSVIAHHRAVTDSLPSNSDRLIQEIRRHDIRFTEGHLRGLLRIARNVDQVAVLRLNTLAGGRIAFDTPNSRSVVIKKIGQGSFKTVDLALRVAHIENREIVSLAALTRCSLQRLSAREQEVQLRELDFLRDLQGRDHIVQMESYCETDTEVVSMLDYYNGGDLFGFIDSYPGSNPLRKTDMRTLIQIARDCASGLAEVHNAGIVHGDIKPENILLRELPSGRTKAALTDFGLAYKPKELQEVGDVMGTVGWLSPEKAGAVIKKEAPNGISVEEFREALSEKSDIWSLGMIFYTLFSGRTLAHYGGAIRQVAAVQQRGIDTQINNTPSLSPALKRLLKSMLSVKPTLRPTALDVSRQLQLLLNRS